MKKFFKIFISIIILFVLFCAGAYLYICNSVKPVSKDDTQTVRFEVSYGLSTKEILNELQNKQLIKNAEICYVLLRRPQLMNFLYPLKNSKTSFSLKSGSYSLNKTMNISQILTELSSGKQEYIKVVFPEGLTLSQTGTILQENNICSKEDFKKSCFNPNILKKFQIPGYSCEGYLFPDTYFLNLNMNSDAVVELMLNTFFDKIKTIPNLAEKTPADLYDTVILSSIVEKEYKIDEEAPLIASVFKNRLRRNIGLYSCATIIYILTEIEGRPHPDRVLTKDTKIDNPYNTYMWAGLPPGPISNPGLIALNASTNTPKTNYYYFQVIDEEKGKHVFNSTFEEHIINH